MDNMEEKEEEYSKKEEYRLKKTRAVHTHTHTQTFWRRKR